MAPSATLVTSASSTREPLWTRGFVLLSGAQLLFNLLHNLFVHLPGHFSALGATEAVTGRIFAFASLCAVLVRLPLARWLVPERRRALLLTGATLTVLACAAHVIPLGLGLWLYLLRAFYGVALAIFAVSIFSTVSEVVPESRRFEGLALFGVFGLVPMGLGGALGDFVLAHGGYPRLFQLVTLCALGVLGFVVALGPLGQRSAFQPGAPAASPLRMLARPELGPLWMLTAVFASTLACHGAFLKTYVLTHGLGSVGGFFFWYAAVAVTLRVFFGSVPDRLGPTRVLGPSLVCLAAGLVSLSLATRPLHVSLAGALSGIGHGFAFPVLFGLVVSRTTLHERGAGVAVFTSLFDFGVMLGAPSVGALIERLGYPPSYRVVAGALLVAAVTFYAWDRRLRMGPSSGATLPR
jgi:predicted MFS family arabinose efflux permease